MFCRNKFYQQKKHHQPTPPQTGGVVFPRLGLSLEQMGVSDQLEEDKECIHDEPQNWFNGFQRIFSQVFFCIKRWACGT